MGISVYDIHTAVHLKNNMSPALLKILGEVGNLDKAFDKLGNVGKAAFGAIGVAAGVTAVAGIMKLAEKGKELMNQQEQLQRVGVSLADVNRMTAESFDKIAKAVPTAQVSDSLRVFRELRGALGDDAAAWALTPKGLKLDELLKNSAGGDQRQAFWDMLRGGEMKGIITDKAKLDALIESATPWFMAQGSKLTPAMFKAFARGAGASWMNTDIDKAMPAMMTAIGDLSGPTAGKAQMSLYQFMMGANQIPQQSAALLQKMGILNPSETKPGGFGKVIPGQLLGAAEHVGDIPGWVRDVLMPAIVKEAGGDPNKEQQILLKILGQNRNALRMAEMYGLPSFQEQILKEKQIAGKVMPLDPAYQQYISKNPAGVESAFHAQWESMLSAIGKPLMIAAMPVMKTLTSLFTSVGSLANANPQFIADLGKTFTILGSTAIGAGVGSLMGLLFGPPGAAVGGLVGAMLGAVAGFAAVKWDEITTGFNTVKDAITKFAEWLHSIGQSIYDYITTLGGLLKKTSFGGGAGGFGGGGSLDTSSPHGAHLQYASLIQKLGGDEASNLMKIYRTEGPEGYAVGDSGKSFGPFQVYTGGGIGNLMLRDGINVRDPSSVPAQIEWMKRYGHRTGGYSSSIWHGLRDKGIGSLRSGAGSVAPYRGVKGQQEVHVHSPVYLDGKMIASNTVTHILKSSEHSRGAAYFDGYHTFAGADRQTATA